MQTVLSPGEKGIVGRCSSDYLRLTDYGLTELRNWDVRDMLASSLCFFSVKEIAGSGLCPCYLSSLRSTERLLLLHALFFFSCRLAALSRKKSFVLFVHIEARIVMVMFLASCRAQGMLGSLQHAPFLVASLVPTLGEMYFFSFSCSVLTSNHVAASCVTNCAGLWRSVTSRLHSCR